jgi:membrane protein required for colicin V production
MTGFDYAVLIILGLSTLMATLRGFVSEVLSLLIWVAALWCALNYSGTVAALALSSVEPPAFRLGAAYLVVFLGVLVLGGTLQWCIRKLIAKAGMSGTDRLLGALFGLLRGALVVLSLVVFAGFSKITTLPEWRESLLIPAVVPLARTLSQHLPDNVRGYLSFAPASLPEPTAETPESEPPKPKPEAERQSKPTSKAESSSTR